MEIVIFQDTCYILQMVISKFWLYEGPLSNHEFILMPFAFNGKNFRNIKLNPIFRFFWKNMLDWDSDFTISKYLIEVLSSTFCIILYKSKLLNFSFMFLKENLSIKSLISLLPQLHDEKVSIKCILSLLV